jgi:RimJ/RimL family protein N-acetyltransferase
VNALNSAIQLRKVVPADLPLLFQFQQNPEANQMAAFTAKDPTDRAAFDAHWEKIMADDSLIANAVLLNGEVIGNVGKFEMFGLPQVTYWIDSAHWGKGIATAALQLFLAEHPARPIYASVAFDNIGSMRVLEKCGFVKASTERGYANARGIEIEEFIFKLDA